MTEEEKLERIKFLQAQLTDLRWLTARLVGKWEPRTNWAAQKWAEAAGYTGPVAWDSDEFCAALAASTVRGPK